MLIFFKLISFIFIIANVSASQKHPIPRFVSLRSSSVNLHVGPGGQYPVEWRYIRAHLPLEIIAEFDTWRLVRDITGTEGWIHQSLLTGRRFVIIANTTQNLRSSSDSRSSVIARLEPGVIAKVVECDTKWCRIDVRSNVGNYRGWLERSAIWGVYPNETKF